MKQIKLREDGLKTCTKCKRLLKLSEFNKNKTQKSGYNCQCKQCVSKSSLFHECKPEYRFRRWALNTIKTHKKFYTVNISLLDLISEATKTINCNICGEKLNWERGTKGKRPRYNNPTLDRIDNSNIMTSINTQIICHRCNTLKSDGTLKDLINYCKKVVEKYND